MVVCRPGASAISASGGVVEDSFCQKREKMQPRQTACATPGNRCLLCASVRFVTQCYAPPFCNATMQNGRGAQHAAYIHGFK
jgi:hypothetical protein